MRYTFEDDKINLYNQMDFNIGQILECGQCFRFEKIENNKYEIIAFGKYLIIEQTSDKISFYPTNISDFEKIWIDYFDLKRDYSYIKEKISDGDKVLKKASEYGSGIRILRQDKWEMLISFIISQNNRIPMIKKVIKNISEKYGTQIGDDKFSFPTPEQLKNATTEDLMLCKTGFRARYILDAIEKVNSNIINLDTIENLSDLELKEELLKIVGVGTKVADCVMLFGFARFNSFPTDVWIKRIMEYFYFDKEDKSVKFIEKFGFEKFGQFSGIAQQYLFFYAIQEKIGK